MEMNLQLTLLATLWENTYRASITNENNEYLATLRLIVSVPKDKSEIPDDAPEVAPQLYVLIEDATISSKQIIDFETALYRILDDKFQKSMRHIFFFYPSPEDMLSKEDPSVLS